jgi:DNA-binding transcriptional ArsR family regulator
MYELIVRLARTVANDERLRILAHLMSHGETAPKELARGLHLSPNALAGHLAKLVAVGLVSRRRSGRWNYCSAASPYRPTALSAMALAWLRGSLVEPTRSTENGSRRTGASSTVAEGREARRLVFEAATAFTDLRRLQIMRRLKEQGPATGAALGQELKISPLAVRRHLNKLQRRGLVGATVAGSGDTCAVADGAKSAVHAEWWRIVSTVLATESFHTS